MHVVATLSIAALVGVACQPTYDPAAEKRAALDTWIQANRAAASAQLDRVKAVAVAAKARSPLASNAVEPVTLQFYDPRTGAGNTEIVTLPDIESPGTSPPVDVVTSMVDMTFVHEMAQLIASGKEQKTLHLIVAAGPDWPATRPLDQALKHLVGLEYLVVVKQTEYVPPRPAGGKSFTPGKYRGDALIYRVADAAYLGGVRIGVTNKQQVRSYDGNSDIYLLMDLEEGIGPVTQKLIAETVGR